MEGIFNISLKKRCFATSLGVHLHDVHAPFYCLFKNTNLELVNVAMAFMDDPETSALLSTHLEHMNVDLKFHSGNLELHNIDRKIKMLKKTAEKNMVRA